MSGHKVSSAIRFRMGGEETAQEYYSQAAPQIL